MDTGSGLPRLGDPPIDLVPVGERGPGLLLEPGTTIRARVLELLAGQRVLLAALGTKIEARTTIPLETGRDLLLKVGEREGSITLRAVEPPPPTSGIAAPAVSPGLEPLVQALQLAVRSSTPQHLVPGTADSATGGGTWSPMDLEAFHRFLGVGFERRILDLDRREAAAVREEVATLRASVRTLPVAAPGDRGPSEAATSVEDGRDLRRELAEGTDGWRREQAARAVQRHPLVYPLPPAPWLRDACLFFDPWIEAEGDGSTDATGVRPFRVVLLLDLVVLGPLRVDLQMRDRIVSVRCTCARERSTALIQNSAPALRAAFEAAGLTLSDLAVLHRRTLPVLDLLAPQSRAEGVVDLEA